MAKLNDLLIESRIPQIGIFWFVDKQLIQYSVPFNSILPVHGFIDSPYDHDALWDKVQKAHPKLNDLEYYDIPRGRIIYATAIKKFSILSSKALIADRIAMIKVMRFFNLPIPQVIYVHDAHYESHADFNDCD